MMIANLDAEVVLSVEKDEEFYRFYEAMRKTFYDGGLVKITLDIDGIEMKLVGDIREQILSPFERFGERLKMRIRAKPSRRRSDA